MKRIVAAVTLLTLLMSAGVHAQQQKLGGTSGTGGIGAFQGQFAVVPVMTITTPSLPSVTVNSAYSQTLTVVNGTAPFAWTIAFGSLPPGLTLNSSTGVISGTATTLGNYVFTVMVTDSTSPTHLVATQQLSIAVTCTPLAIVSNPILPPALVGTAYSFQFNSSGGLGTVTWAASGLSPPYSLAPTGSLTGTPTAANTQTFTVTATDSCPVPQSVQQTATLTTNNTVQIVTPTPLPDAVAGSPDSVQFSAQGGTPPYTWAQLSGTLPPGMAFSPAGVFNGTPTTVGIYNFTIQVTDNASVIDSGPFTITVNCSPLSISTTTVPNGVQGVAYNFQLTSVGGFAPVNWVGTSLPNGLTVSPSGAITGVPSSPGTFNPTFTATDSCSTTQTASINPTLLISTGLTITTNATLPNGTVGTPYTAPMTATGGIPPYQWTVPSGPIPAGAEDVLDWMAMKLPDRLTNHLTGGLNPKYFKIDGGVIWQIKSNNGNPWDLNLYDANFVYLSATDNNDASQQAACQAAGFTSCFVDPFAYKMAVTPTPLSPRYVTQGVGFTILTPPVLTGGFQVNPYIRTTNCGADNQPILFLGNKKVVGSWPTVAWGGDVGTALTLEVDYFYSGDITGTYQNRERFSYVKPFGWVGWDHASLQGGVYVVDQTSINNVKTGGGAPVPNFGCKVPNVPLQGVLPPGVTATSAPEMNIKSDTGVISGTPSTAGSHSFTVQVEDSVGNITQQNMTMTTACPALFMGSTSPLPLATIGIPYSFQFSSTGGLLPVTWARVNGTGSIPAGLTLSNTGLLSGTPTATGTSTFIVQATDSCQPPPSQSVQGTFQLAVQANSGPITITSTSPLQAAIEAQSYSVTLGVTGGTSPYTWSLVSGALPTGLSLVPATGVITGTPTATGTSTFTVRVTDALSGTTTKLLQITVTCPTLAITSPSTLPGAAQNQAYSFQFSSSGGTGAITWGATGVPAGMTLSPSGLLSGTPTGSGTISISVNATDHCSPTPQVASGSYSITISAAPPPLVITTGTPLPGGTQGVLYSVTMAATGGVPPYTWSQIGGTLPAGITFTSPAGIISGTPTTIGTTSVTVQVADSAGHTTPGTFAITISCVPLTITSGLTLPTGTQNQLYSDQLASSGGTGTIAWSLVGGAFPTGVAVSGTGLISGTPSTAGTFNPQIRATDACSTPQTATSTFTLVINPAVVPLQITTPPTLPTATINTPYSITLSASGGTPPYSGWTVTVGTLPTGLTLTAGTGVIAGTPTVAGTQTFTVRVSDSVAATATLVMTLTVNAASGADNRYCTNSNTIFNLSQDGPAKPIQACTNTALANSPSPGSVVTVTANSCSSLQSAVSAAVAGQTIKVPPGTYSPCTITLAASGNATNWITLETSATANLPAEGSRISPAWIGIPSLHIACPAGSVGTECGRPAYSQPSAPGTYLPTIVGTGNPNNNAIVITGNFWRLIGLHPTSPNGVNATQVVSQQGASTHIILDRMVINGGNSPTGQDRDNVQAAVRFSACSFCAVVDSYLYDTHCVSNGTCVDSQAISLGGSSTSQDGPIKVVDDFLETSGESVLSGGGGAGATNTTFPASDIEFRRNHVWKPLFWKANDPSYFGTNFEIKNCMEHKNTVRMLAEGNIFEQEWTGQSDQHGICVLFDSKNQSSSVSGTASSNGTGTLTYISGAHFTNSVVSANCATPNQCLVKYNGVVYKAQTFVSANQITVAPAPPILASGSYIQFQPGLNPAANTKDVTFRYNKISHTTAGIQMANSASDGGDISQGGSDFTIHDIAMDDTDGPRWATTNGACCVWGYGFAIQSFEGGTSNLHDITIHNVTALVTVSTSTTPSGSGGFMITGNQTVPGSSIGNFRFYDNVGTAGVITGGSPTCPNTLIARTIVICWTPASQLCFDNNFFAVTTTPSSGTGSFSRNNPPYPSGADNGFCPYGAPKGITLPANFTTYQFTNLNGANGGNYQLLNTSPYHNLGSNGADPGVNWPLLQQNIAGVQ